MQISALQKDTYWGTQCIRHLLRFLIFLLFRIEWLHMIRLILSRMLLLHHHGYVQRR